MRVARFASVLAVLALVASAHASAGAPGAPSGLHGFLLRADEPAAAAFHRTPSFAWNPVPGAVSYEFQLSISDTFRENGILYRNNQLLTPVEAPPLTLPWITGSPHSLYARVRAILPDATTPWSPAYGFDVTPPPPPKPLPGHPGVIRWTPIPGAESYDVWFVDLPKGVTVRTNVLDLRELYTFHQSQQWIGTVRWRIRASRTDTFNYRINGMPVAQHGAWSPVYSSTNPAFVTGPLKLLGTVSDVYSDGSSGSAAHKTMPAFLWSGNQALDGTTAELYRVYVFTDSQCLNPVFTGAVTGSPAYAPRPYGPLALPGTSAAVGAARGKYLSDGNQPKQLMADGTALTPNTTESASEATKTVTVPGDVPSAPGTTPPIGPGGSSPSTGSGSSSGGASGSGGIQIAGNWGAPVSLWDVDWPRAGYYWTVVPVAAVTPAAAATTVAAPGAPSGARVVPVVSTSGFNVGDTIVIGSQTVSITAISNGSLTVSPALATAHPAGDNVVSGGSSLVYTDLELPQDVCAAGRVQRFGIASEPTLTTAQAPFATGLSATGRLTSAARTPAFYGQPLVAWTPALGASIYQVQWSKTRYPFKPEDDPRTTTKGHLTFSNSAILPLKPGTWYYRVRGFNYNLPTGVQQMGWSDPEKLVVTAPKFKVATAPKKKFRVGK